MRTFAAASLALTLSLVAMGTSLAAQESAAQVTGHVLTRDGRPVASALIQVLNLASRGAVADRSGQFKMRLPAGEHVLRVQAIGYDTEARWVLVQEADSVGVDVRLAERQVPFPGADYSLPRQELLDAAAQILPELLSNLQLLDELRSELLGDRFAAFVYWYPTLDTTVTRRGAEVRIMGTCPSCVSGTSRTIEGGGRYTVGTPHLQIGVTATGANEDNLRFCMGAALRGQARLRNCGNATNWLLYVRRPNGSWVAVPEL